MGATPESRERLNRFMMMSGMSGPSFLRISVGRASEPEIADGLRDRSWVATSESVIEICSSLTKSHSALLVVDNPGLGDGLVCTVAGAGTYRPAK